MKNLKRIPNIITLIRLLLVPLFVFFFFSNIPNKKTVYLTIFIVSGISDVLDGYLARKFGWESELGKILDPVADKATQLCVSVCVATMMKQLMWVPIYQVVKDLLLICGAAGLFKRENIIVKSNWAGKLASVIYYFTFLILLFFDNELSYSLAQILCGFFVAFSVLAFVVYVNKYFNGKRKA